MILMKILRSVYKVCADLLMKFQRCLLRQYICEHLRVIFEISLLVNQKEVENRSVRLQEVERHQPRLAVLENREIYMKINNLPS